MLSSDLRDAVRLVSVTNPSELVRFTNNGKTKKVSPEELIVYIARVSNPSPFR